MIYRAVLFYKTCDDFKNYSLLIINFFKAPATPAHHLPGFLHL